MKSGALGTATRDACLLPVTGPSGTALGTTKILDRSPFETGVCTFYLYLEESPSFIFKSTPIADPSGTCLLGLRLLMTLLALTAAGVRPQPRESSRELL